MDAAVARLALYTEVAEQTASAVIRRYSTSFGMASRLLGPAVRQGVENIYALVRVADEVVDGAAEQAGLSTVEAARLLNDLESDTEHGMAEGYSANLIVHAFSGTARAAGFGAELTSPFFASMRTDLTRTVHDAESFREYVYGSAEVVGLMCLRVFLSDADREYSDAEAAALVVGARALGSAFQKVNFLRDLQADSETLGRSYFPGVDSATLTDVQKIALCDDIDAELATAAGTLALLPQSSRRAVALAHGLFAELARRIRATPASALARTRVRVPDPIKVRIALAAATRGGNV
jgi:phytoene synthase